jgi:hypothetical protein
MGVSTMSYSDYPPLAAHPTHRLGAGGFLGLFGLGRKGARPRDFVAHGHL